MENFDRNYEWKAVTLLSLGFGLVGLDRWIISPLLPAMVKDLNLNYQDVGYIFAVLGILWGLFAILTGILSYKFCSHSCSCKTLQAGIDAGNSTKRISFIWFGSWSHYSHTTFESCSF